jgi:hypothetical protein
MGNNFAKQISTNQSLHSKPAQPARRHKTRPNMKFYLLSIVVSQPLAIATDFTFNNNFATMLASCLTTIATAYIYTKFKK